MTKNLKLSIKNTQIAGAINLGGLKAKLAKKKDAADEVPFEEKSATEKVVKTKKKAPVIAEEKAAAKTAKADKNNFVDTSERVETESGQKTEKKRARAPAAKTKEMDAVAEATQEPVKREQVKQSSPKPILNPESIKSANSVKSEPVKSEPIKSESVKPELVKHDLQQTKKEPLKEREGVPEKNQIPSRTTSSSTVAAAPSAGVVTTKAEKASSSSFSPSGPAKSNNRSAETRDHQELRSSYQKRGEPPSSAHFKPKPMESKPYQERQETVASSSSDAGKQFVRPLPGGDRPYGSPQPIPGYQENQKARQQQQLRNEAASSSSSSFDEQRGQSPHRGASASPRREGSSTGYPPREGGGYPPREGSGGGYPPRREGSGGYPPRREGSGGGYPPRREGSGGYPPRREGPGGGYPPREGGPPRREGSSAGYPPREGGGYPPRREGSGGGYPPREGGGYPPRRDGPGGGYPPRREGSGGYPPRRDAPAGGYPPRRDGPGGGYPPREGGASGPRGFSQRPILPPKGFGQKEEFLIDEQRRSRSDFEEAAKKFPKGKLKEPTAPKSTRKGEEKVFDARARHGFISDDEEAGSWRAKRRPKANQHHFAQQEVRPTKIKVRLPIILKDLAVEMKLKASELISKLFLQGMVLTLNDLLDDATVVGLLGHEFGCEIVIDTTEESRIRISDQKVAEEIKDEESTHLVTRPPVVAFMGHVDHGKTSLIDAIRKSNRAAKEVGAITQHIGAFKCETIHGFITILDTPGHEAFTLMRERGAEVTDIVVLVVAGDEGIQEQTIEAIKQARNAKATIVVALTKCDKPNFDAERVYRQLADQDLLPESWGGQTITLNCSAVSGQGIPELLEMLALQAEILELKANPERRARGMVIESQMQQGLGAVATVLVQNGTLRVGDALVFGVKWAKVKTMRDEHGLELAIAVPSTPVQITGLSGLPEAGEEFIVVKNEKEARDIAEARQEGRRQSTFQLKKRSSLESMMESASHAVKQKVLNLILRADVQGSLEALVKALEKAKSDKVEVNIISQGVGQISESDAHLAAVSGAIILGFHTVVETHAEPLIKEMGVKVLLNDIIYHAVDIVKEQMKGLLDKLAQEVEKGSAEVKAIFKSSQLGIIAGCQVIEGVIARNHQMRVKRGEEIVWKGSISSLKRVKDDVKEVQKGIECGICLSGFSDVRVGDILQAYDIIYVVQEL